MSQQSRILVAFALALTGALLACSDQSEHELLESAKGSISNGDSKKAAIELKNLLAANPKSGPGRLVFGELLLNIGQPPQAEVELRKAIELGEAKKVILPLIAEAMTAQGKHRALVEEFAEVVIPDDQSANANLRSNVALAQLRLGMRDRAQANIDSVLRVQPQHIPSKMVLARLMTSRGDTESALQVVREIIVKQPQNIEAMQLEGDLLQHGMKDSAGAMVMYKRVLAIRPDYLPAHSSLISALLTQQDLDGAARQSQTLTQLLPNTPRAKYFEALVALAKKDFNVARSNFQALLSVSPDDPRLLPLAGAVELQTNSLARAEAYLSKAVSIAPDNSLARRLLAATYLRSGQPEKALQSLRPLLERGSPELEVLTLAAEAYMLAGDMTRAEQYFNSASKLRPDDNRVRTALALTSLSRGNVDAAFTELESIAKTDKDVLADLEIINARLRRGELDEALAGISSLERKQPSKAIAPNLRARVLLARNDTAGARRNFEAALAKEPTFYPAAAGLAALDLESKQPDQARKRFESILKLEPKNLQALMAVADLEARLGSSKNKSAELISAAITANPGEPAPRIMLIDHFLRHHDAKSALAAAQAGAAAIKDSPDILDALGRSQLASGEINQAISSFTKVISVQPNTVKAYQSLADAFFQANDTASAIATLKRGLALVPESQNLQRELIKLYLLAKQPAKGLETARTMQRQRPSVAIGWVFEGDVLAQQRDLDGAIKAYATGMTKPEPGIAASRLHAVLLTAKRPDEAKRAAEAWLKTHPRDIEFLLYLADLAMVDRDFLEAENLYRNVIRIEPKTPRALNNYAWLLAHANKPGAVAAAESAVALLPRNAAVLDTLAFALVQDKQADKALVIANQVIAIAPDNPEHRLTLARALLASGNRAEAKAELDRLTALGEKFGSQSEVRKLLKGL